MVAILEQLMHDAEGGEIYPVDQEGLDSIKEDFGIDLNLMMHLAYVKAQESRDPSSQNGAVLLDKHGSVLAMDCNQFPDGVEESAERWERPLKYSFIEHAERNTIFQAVRRGHSLEDTALVCPWAACADCARAIVQAGVIQLVRAIPSEANLERWRASCEAGDAIMLESGVDIYEIPFTWPEPFTIVRDGLPFWPTYPPEVVFTGTEESTLILRDLEISGRIRLEGVLNGEIRNCNFGTNGFPVE